MPQSELTWSIASLEHHRLPSLSEAPGVTGAFHSHEVDAARGALARGGRAVPDSDVLAGLGIAVDRRALRRYGRRFSVMDRKRLIWFSLRTRGLAASREIDRRRKERLAAAQPPPEPES